MIDYGAEYNIICYDEFDWDYSGTSKGKQLISMLAELGTLGFYPEVVTKWYRFIVLDCRKNSDFRYEPGVKAILNKYNDAWYWYSSDDSYALRKGNSQAVKSPNELILDSRKFSEIINTHCECGGINKCIACDIYNEVIKANEQ
jgi:hypothetical protein